MRSNLRGILSRVDRISADLQEDGGDGCRRGYFDGHHSGQVFFWIGDTPEPDLPEAEMCECGQPLTHTVFRLHVDGDEARDEHGTA